MEAIMDMRKQADTAMSSTQLLRVPKSAGPGRFLKDFHEEVAPLQISRLLPQKKIQQDRS